LLQVGTADRGLNEICLKGAEPKRQGAEDKPWRVLFPDLDWKPPEIE
jgi:hypothetical protein